VTMEKIKSVKISFFIIVVLKFHEIYEFLITN